MYWRSTDSAVIRRMLAQSITEADGVELLATAGGWQRGSGTRRAVEAAKQPRGRNWYAGSRRVATVGRPRRGRPFDARLPVSDRIESRGDLKTAVASIAVDSLECSHVPANRAVTRLSRSHAPSPLKQSFVAAITDRSLEHLCATRTISQQILLCGGIACLAKGCDNYAR